MLMSFFNSITGSYILALLLYALIFKIVLIPFTIKQQKNQIKMAGLAPKIQLIKAKYKGRTDQRSMQKQQDEIMQLQQKEGYNGCSGCLPLLIQLPIIMLLYAVIQSPLSYIATTTDVVTEYNQNYSNSEYEIHPEIIEIYGNDIYKKNEDGTLYQENGEYVRVAVDPIAKLKDRYFTDTEDKSKIGEIAVINKIYQNVYSEDGSVRQEEIDYIEKLGIKWDSIPDFRLFGINLADSPDIMNPSIIIIIPFLAAAASWLSMWLAKKLNGSNNMAAGAQDEQTAKSMKVMDLVMPLMTLWIAFNFSGMLGLYWVIQSLLGLLQTFIMSKAMPIPRFTEEEIRELHRQEKEIEKAARAAAKTTRHRSLHYIDEDDYDELPDAPVSESGKSGTSFNGDAPEIKD